MAFIESIFLIGSVCALIYYWCKHNYSFWSRHGIPQMDPTPLVGDITPFLTLKSNFGRHLSSIYSDKRVSKEAVVGIYILNKPGLIIRDVDLIKSILIKDFNKFSNRYGSADPHGDSLGANNLFFVKNPFWKEMRTKLTPVFTSGKIKQMYPLMLEIANELENHLSRYTKKYQSENFTEEVKEICSSFTTDMIASIAFGIRPNSLANPQAEFRRVCREMFNFDIFRAKDFFIGFFLPNLVSTLRVKLFTQEFSDMVRNTMNHVMSEREKTGVQRNDLIDILVALKKAQTFKPTGPIGSPKENDILLAQGALFLSAGFETSSSTMSFALYELAKHPDLEQRLREEICEAFVAGNGTISYEDFNSLEYLSMVVDETLRMYPVLPFLDREHVKINGEEPFNLKPHYDFTLPEGLAIYIPIYGLQRDPKYWSDPNTFDPERFSKENKKLINPMAYLPFGTGPHNCIGSRIGLLQTKLGLVHFLKNYSVSLSKRTPREPVFDPKAFVLQATGGIYLDIKYDQMYEKCAAKA